MKNIFLLIILAVVGYWAYIKYFSPEPELIVAEAQRRPVSMGVKKSVRALLEEFKSRKVLYKGEHTTKIVPEHELAEIQKYLFREGFYSTNALQNFIAKLLLEMGVSPNEADGLAQNLIELRTLDKKEKTAEKPRLR